MVIKFFSSSLSSKSRRDIVSPSISPLGNTTSSSADDWLFSPEISLEANRDYILEYAVSLRGVFGDVTVDVVEGTSADNAQLLGHEVYSHHSGIVARRSHVRTGDQGTLSVGFHLQMPPANGVVSLMMRRPTRSTRVLSHNSHLLKIFRHWHF